MARGADRGRGGIAANRTPRSADGEGDDDEDEDERGAAAPRPTGMATIERGVGEVFCFGWGRKEEEEARGALGKRKQTPALGRRMGSLGASEGRWETP